MSRTPRQWLLNGPATFLREVAQIANENGVAVVVAPPHCPPQIDAALEAALHQPWLPSIDAKSDEPPLAGLSRAFEVEARSAAALPVDRAAEGKAAIVEGLDEASLQRRETTLRAWVGGCSRRQRFGAVLVVVITPACESAIKGIGVRVLPWRGVIGSRDAMSWALDGMPNALDPLLGRLAVETAVQLAGWDLDSVARLVESFATTPRRMFDFSQSFAEGLPMPSWSDGTSDLFDDVAFSKLGCCGREEIARRIWRAQVTVLFGWLESERNGFVRRHRRALLELVNRSRVLAADLDTLEWADIARLVKPAFVAGDRRVELADEARAVRNALAHLEPIDYPRFARIRLLTRGDRGESDGS